MLVESVNPPIRVRTGERDVIAATPHACGDGNIDLALTTGGLPAARDVTLEATLVADASSPAS
jgi:molybdopterin biosynthesis enzyme MoaB